MFTIKFAGPIKLKNAEETSLSKSLFANLILFLEVNSMWLYWVEAFVLLFILVCLPLYVTDVLAALCPLVTGIPSTFHCFPHLSQTLVLKKEKTSYFNHMITV